MQQRVCNFSTKRPFNGWGHWWPLLIGPVAMVLVYVAHVLQWSRLLDKSLQETLALVITVLAFVGFAIRYYRGRSPVHLILVVLAVVFFCREVHFAGTSSGVYVALVVIGAWAIHWRRRLKPLMDGGQLRFWLVSTFATYLLSQLIARRVFRFLPHESELHIPLEEIVENVAHLMFFVTSFVGRRQGSISRT